MDKIACFSTLLFLALLPLLSSSQGRNPAYIKQLNLVSLDSTLYQHEKEIRRYPYRTKYDSLVQVLKKLPDSSPRKKVLSDIGGFGSHYGINIFPEYFAELENGDKITLPEYRKLIKDELPKDLACIINITVEWNGTISRIKFERCKMPYPESFDIMPYVNRIKAKAAKLDGIPLPGSRSNRWLIEGN